MFRSTRFATAVVSAALVMSACAGSGVPTVTGSNTTQGESAAGADVAVAQAPEPVVDKSGILTLSDGTVIELVVGSCATKATDPNSFFIDNGFDVSGNSPDGHYHFGAVKASFEGDPAPVVDLTGEFDENRVNPKIQYINLGISPDVPTTLVADGASVYGEVVLRDFHSVNPVFGATVTAAVQFNCG